MAFAEPNLPAAYEQYLNNDEVYAAYERIAQTSLVGYMMEMEDAYTPGEILADIRAEEEADPNEAILHLNQWANPYKPSIHIFDRTIQEMLPEGMRVINLPNNARKNRYYELKESSMWCLDGLRPELAFVSLASQQLEAVARKGIERVHIVGPSQGAAVGAVAMRLAENYGLEVVSATFFDAPNDVPERAGKPKQLRADFQGKGLENLYAFNDAVNDAAIPALNEAHGIDGTRRGIARQIRGFGGVWLDSRLESNRVMHQAMATDTFSGDLGAVRAAYANKGLPMPPTVAAVFEDSAIGNHEGVDVDCVTDLNVPGYGHEGMDNVTLMGILVRRAITGDELAA